MPVSPGGYLVASAPFNPQIRSIICYTTVLDNLTKAVLCYPVSSLDCESTFVFIQPHRTDPPYSPIMTPRTLEQDETR